MTSYRFDLYPRTDPRDGTLIRSFTELQKAAYRAEANGTSTGQIAVRSTTDDGQAIDPLGLQYVRVVELPGGGVRGGFFLEKGKFQALSEDEDSLLTFSGAGTLAYLARAAMAPHTYLDTAIGTDPYDDTWRWGDQGPAAGGDFIGAALWRTIYEAQHFRVAGTQHRHADGVIYTDSHDDDRTESAIPDVVMTFDQYEDSSGNAWTIASGDLKSQVGESVLSVVKRLMEAGLYVELDPDTFELNAWEQDVHRAMLDATGTAWATDVVRFQAPTDPDDITTGNIKDDAVRNIEAYIKRSALWAGGNDVYGLATSGTDIPWEGHYRADIEDAEALEAIAAVQLQAIADAGDTLKLQLWMDDDPANGRYLPWEHVKLDQSVTVHTGTDQWEFDERTFPVAAITVELRQGGNWQAIVELGASYSASGDRSFRVAGGRASGIQLCDPTIPGSDATRHTGATYDGVTAEDNSQTLNGGSNLEDGDEGTNAELLPFNNFVRATFPAAVSVSSWRVTQSAAESGVRRATTITLWSNDHPTSPTLGTWTLRDTATDACVDTGTRAITPVSARYWRIGHDGTQCTSGLTFSWRMTEWYLYSGGTAGTNPYTGNSNRAARCDHTHPAEEHEHDGYSPIDHAHTLGELDDVDVDPGPSEGDVLVWDDTAEKWVPEAPSGGAVALDGLTDVTIATPADGQVLTYDSGTGEWVNENSASGFSNPMTTAGDIITGGASGTPARLGIGSALQHLRVNAGATALEYADPPAGGSGAGWNQDVDEDGSSFANFTANSGTWASDAGVIKQTVQTATHRYARYNTIIPLGFPMIYEAEILVDSAGGSPSHVGLHIGYNGASGTGGLGVHLTQSNNTIQIERQGVAIVDTLAATLALDTWYKLRICVSGPWVSVYLDGTLLGSCLVVLSAADPSYIGLVTYNATGWFRNIKFWTLTTGVPA